MATKELLIMILVTVIIGISIAVAVQTINSGELSPNRAAITQGLYDAVGNARAYYERMRMYGGGQNSFQDIRFEDLLMDSVTGHGTYEITNRSDESFTLIGRPTNINVELRVTIFRDSLIWEEDEN